ncbi:MAG: class I SAM-dependent methyltransferase [Clostridia bacterium]|nr:class I SAM-dependent methyltransferase [Clostridia bacterium]
MKTRTKILLGLNNLFPAPTHPFNLQNEGKKSYAMWQYENGETTIELYLQGYSKEQMFKDKIVVDVGCGAAGKSLYYASLGAEKVYGLELLDKYREEAEALAEETGLSDKFEFVAGDSANMPFEDKFADTIIVNDAMEHVSEPEKTIKEMLRILKPGGRIFINFPPYYHPMGAHLTDAIYIPWVQMFFPDDVLIEGYKELVKDVPDGEDRVNFRISKDENGKEYFSYINKMTIKRFKKILKAMNIAPEYYSEVPLRGFLKPAAKLSFSKEMFVKMAVCVIKKD